jgi:hypothetical protein
MKVQTCELFIPLLPQLGPTVLKLRYDLTSFLPFRFPSKIRKPPLRSFHNSLIYQTCGSHGLRNLFAILITGKKAGHNIS